MLYVLRKNIPNFLTCCNLISGCISSVLAFKENLYMAFLFMIIGAIFDFFDGFCARVLHVSSPIGKELDSLADVITFGFAPSVMVFVFLYTQAVTSFSEPIMSFLPFIAFLLTAFSALRLAFFNLDERQTSTFIGLPTPANALFWASLIINLEHKSTSSFYTIIAVIILIFLCCKLLICNIAMFSLKFKHWNWYGNEIRYVFIASCVPLLLAFQFRAFSYIIAWYVVLSIISNRLIRQQKK